MTELKFIDLFCGVGGFHQALNKLQSDGKNTFKCVFACDIDKTCRDTYEKNYDIKPVGDIRKVKIKDIPPFDIACAGFPCNPYSKSGKRKGFEDEEKGSLFFDMCKIIKHHRPKYLIFENVKNIISHDKKRTWTRIVRDIRGMGYNCYDTPMVLNVLHFNCPQNRERVIGNQRSPY